MAQKGVQLDQQNFSCAICLDLLKDPVSLPCGHNYCMDCIKPHWDVEDMRGIYSCPQCRKTFEHKGHDIVSAAGERAERQKKVRESRLKIQQRIQDREKDVKVLQQQVEAINGSADKTVEDSEKMLTELIRLIQKRSSDEKLEQEIAELKRKDGELERLSHTEDPIQFLHSDPLLSALRESPHSSSIHVGPLSYFEDEITLDLNTAHRRLELSEGNRKVTFMGPPRPYPEHPDRFTGWSQVLSRESLSERCYWEVEWRGLGVDVAVAYKDMERAGRGNECRFGYTDKSWLLDCDEDRFIFRHNNISTDISGPGSSRVGVFLDHRAETSCQSNIVGSLSTSSHGSLFLFLWFKWNSFLCLSAMEAVTAHHHGLMDSDVSPHENGNSSVL
ncbi:E3 ubiquitin-protein ligase RNF135-like [Pholidichthys leucotaenia]